MVEIIALIFLTRQIGELAVRKGEKSMPWKLYTVLAWFCFEIAGVAMSMAIFGTHNIIGIMLLGIVSAFGGYLLVRAQLLKKPDFYDDDIENIGNPI